MFYNLLITFVYQLVSVRVPDDNIMKVTASTSILERADKLLYEAKQKGKNQVVSG